MSPCNNLFNKTPKSIMTTNRVSLVGHYSRKIQTGSGAGGGSGSGGGGEGLRIYFSEKISTCSFSIVQYQTKVHDLDPPCLDFSWNSPITKCCTYKLYKTYLQLFNSQIQNLKYMNERMNE